MSKYIQRVRLGHIKRLALVTGGGRSLEQVKAAEQPDLICNAGFFEALGKPTHHLKADGVVRAKAAWGCWGYAWDSGGDIALTALPADERANYIGGYELLTPMVGIQDALSYGAELGSRRGRTAMALDGENLILYVSGDGTADAATPEELRAELYTLGAETAVMLDGGGSSQCDFGGGQVIRSSRAVDSYLCVWLTEEENDKEDTTVSDKKIVCLDPGHGPDTVNGSPDGTYKEREFAWDMGQRIKALLEAQGVSVAVTRTEDAKPSLTERAAVSNAAGADCLVSLHSNAAGNGGWYDAQGLMIYTSAGPDYAPRNVLAMDIIDRMKEAGVLVRSTPIVYDMGLTVLVETDAPACLIEYGFHTNREDTALLKDSTYRDKLARATAHGICDWLGVEWKEPEEPQQPAGDKPADWAEEGWAWAQAMGLMDGTRPTANITRQEVAVMFKRFYEAVKAGK